MDEVKNTPYLLFIWHFDCKPDSGPLIFSTEKKLQDYLIEGINLRKYGYCGDELNKDDELLKEINQYKEKLYKLSLFNLTKKYVSEHWIQAMLIRDGSILYHYCLENEALTKKWIKNGVKFSK